VVLVGLVLAASLGLAPRNREEPGSVAP
jgi:hypothetical protein